MDFMILRDLLGSGADMAIIALLVVMWRFDRRLLKLETLFTLKPKA